MNPFTMKTKLNLKRETIDVNPFSLQCYFYYSRVNNNIAGFSIDDNTWKKPLIMHDASMMFPLSL